MRLDHNFIFLSWHSQYIWRGTDFKSVPLLFNNISVAIAERSHPLPFRTRKLSSFAPMVLHGRLCGRVGSRRNLKICPLHPWRRGCFFGVGYHGLLANFHRSTRHIVIILPDFTLPVLKPLRLTYLLQRPQARISEGPRHHAYGEGPSAGQGHRPG